MKKQFASRKHILLAIKAALAAIFLAGGRAEAQFIYNGQAPADIITVQSASGTTNTLMADGKFHGSFLDSGLGTNDVTINSDATITKTNAIIEFGLHGGGGGSVTNEGTLMCQLNFECRS